MRQEDDTKAFWRERVEEHGSSCRATLRETAVRFAEIKVIEKYLSEGQRIVDIGCGNGFSTIQWAKSVKSEFLGIDYVQEMIDVAYEELKKNRSTLRGHLRFQLGNVTSLNLDKKVFDIAITERCLQNLTSFDKQITAIKGISEIVKDKGLFLMLECSKTAVDKINNLLKKLRRPPIDPIPWHNLFFEDEKLIQNVESMTSFKLVTIDHFASNYIFVTRILPSLISTILFKLRLGQVLWNIPQMGDWGYFKLYVWKKAPSLSTTESKQRKCENQDATP
jgi:ubiquinone/menaquinone biosynthesis C-methylase UbiE